MIEVNELSILVLLYYAVLHVFAGWGFGSIISEIREYL